MILIIALSIIILDVQRLLAAMYVGVFCYGYGERVNFKTCLLLDVYIIYTHFLEERCREACSEKLFSLAFPTRVKISLTLRQCIF